MTPLDQYQRIVLGYCLYTALEAVYMIWKAITS